MYICRNNLNSKEMETKKIKVHMLPTEDKSTLYQFDKKNLHIGDYDICHPNDKDRVNQHLYFTSDEEIKEGDWYIDSSSDLTTVQQCKAKPSKALQEEINCRKIVATTDKSLKIFKCIRHLNNLRANVDCNCEYLPQISQQFIEEYVKAGGIDEVLLELENWQTTNTWNKDKRLYDENLDSYTLKTDQNNCVIIHPVKSKLYTEEEVIQIIYNSSYVLSNGDTTKGHADNWIKENLK